ncbi:Serine/threonine-protein kinase 4 [Lobulomyces angularis]|nr:Serine/threonine-protein kinase 4 [Lobulomyces angularis]
MNEHFVLTPEELNEDPAEIFTVLNKLGEGSYGAVYKGIHKRTSTLCAIKMIPIENDLDDSVKEISMMRNCNSNYVVHFYGSFLNDNYLWIVMEYCGAGSVADIMRLCNTVMTEEQISVICSFTLSGLSYLHSYRKIHRDIKAGNILLNTVGEVKLADFGVASQLTDSKTKRLTVIGTPYWIAPEVLGDQGYGIEADIWSLGITCIEMAEGRPPYHDINPMKAIFQIPKNPPPKFSDPSKFSNNFIDFLSKCLKKNPEHRPSAEVLLKHPFIVESPGLSIMTDIVTEALEEIGRVGLVNDDDDIEDDFDSEMDLESRNTSDNESESDKLIQRNNDVYSSDEEEDVNIDTATFDDSTMKAVQKDVNNLHVETEVEVLSVEDTENNKAETDDSKPFLEEPKNSTEYEKQRYVEDSDAEGQKKSIQIGKKVNINNSNNNDENIFTEFDSGTIKKVDLTNQRKEGKINFMQNDQLTNSNNQFFNDSNTDDKTNSPTFNNNDNLDQISFPVQSLDYKNTIKPINESKQPKPKGNLESTHTTSSAISASNKAFKPTSTENNTNSRKPKALHEPPDLYDLISNKLSVEELKNLLRALEINFDVEFNSIKSKYGKKREPLVEALILKQQQGV